MPASLPRAVAIASIAALVAGCGSTRLLARGRSSTTTAATAAGPAPAAPAAPAAPTGDTPAGHSDVTVIRGWSEALSRGDIRAAASYFAIPSVMINGAGVAGAELVTKIATVGEARAANASLPCGAVLITAVQRGHFVNALFRLTSRRGGGAGCGGGVGQTARTNFLIARGHIAEWIRAPDQPGDNGTPSVPSPPAPLGSQSATPSV